MELKRRVFELLATAFLITSFTAASTQAQTNSQQSAEQHLVKLNVLVTDGAKRPVSDVKQEEFRVFENGVPQTISLFSKEETPLLYGIVIDNSASFKSVLAPVIRAVKTIVDQNNPNDETLIVRFIDSDKIETVIDFTSDKAELFKSLESLFIEGGQSSVIDAVYVTAQRISEYKRDDSVNRRRAIILITDGEDRSSHYKKDQLIDLLRKERLQVFVIGFLENLDDWDSFKRQTRSPRERATDLLRTVTEETGGLTFLPKSPEKLQSIANEFMLHLHTQYVIGYVPTSSERQKPQRKVSVKLLDSPERKKHTVTTGPGYLTAIKR